MSILLDAGPSLNFLAVGQENILIKIAAQHGLQLAVPERVDAEIVGMCNDARFARTPALSTWKKLKTAQRVLLLDDALVGAEFTDAVSRISGVPAAARVGQRKSLGEILVLAHASALAQQGKTVFVLIDESDGRRRAEQEQLWLQRRRFSGRVVLWSTPQVLRQAPPGTIKRGLAWKVVYDQMRVFDDGLVKL